MPRAMQGQHAFAPRLSAPFALLIAVAYGALMVLTPWESFRGEQFPDLQVYLDGFESGAYDYLDDLDGLSFLFSEPLWRVVVSGLSEAFDSVPLAFQFISFSTSTVFSYVLLRVRPEAGIFLLTPLVVDLLISQVRSALMISVFYIGLLAGVRVLWGPLFVLAFLVHSAAIIVVGYYALAQLLKWLSSRHPSISMILTVGASVLIPVVYAVAHSGLLAAVGDRRAETEATSPGGSFVLFFALYYAVMLINIGVVVRHAIAVLPFLVCGSFLVLSIFEINFLRVTALIFPLLILSTFLLPSRGRWIVWSGLFVMCLYHSYLWLGFGA